MASWQERFQKLSDGVRQRMSGPRKAKPIEQLETDDPRLSLQPMEQGDWLCPFCLQTLAVPGWDGSPGGVLEQPEVAAHIEACPRVPRDGSKPEPRPWEELVEQVLRQRLAAWPQYQIANAHGDWICPHCLKNTGVMRRVWDGSPVELDWFLPNAMVHLRQCAEYLSMPLHPRPAEEVGAGVEQRDMRVNLLARVARDPIFRVCDDNGVWVDPFSEQPVPHINLHHAVWGPAVQGTITDYLLSPACPGFRSNFRTDKTVEQLSRIAGRLSALQHAVPEAQLNAEAEKELEFLRQRVTELNVTAGQAEEMKKDLESARSVQLKMLPDKPPRIAGYEVSALYQPCVELGGDMFHFIDAGPGLTGFLIGDVSGHGVDAAMIMASTLKSCLMRGKGLASPAEVLAAVNADLWGNLPRGRFVSAFYLVLEHATGRLACARAGHNPAILADPRETAYQLLEGVGPVLGVVQPEQFAGKLKEYTSTLPPGGTLLLYTDGLPEAHNAKREQFDDERLYRVFWEHAALPSRKVIEAISTALEGHLAGIPMEDDLTMIAIRRLGK